LMRKHQQWESLAEVLLPRLEAVALPPLTTSGFAE
jgi:hypothetical protein